MHSLEDFGASRVSRPKPRRSGSGKARSGARATRITCGLAAAILPGFCLAAGPEIPLEVYGQLPTVSSMAISPGGDRIAFRRTDGTIDAVFIVDRRSGDVLGAVDGSETHIRDLVFLEEERLLLYAAESENLRRFGRKLEISGSFVYELPTKRLSKLLEHSRYLYPLQSGVGRIIGYARERDALYMPAYIGDVTGTPATYGLLEVTMANPGGTLVTRGGADTIDWIVDDNGGLVAEEAYNDFVTRIWDRRGGKRILVHESGRGEQHYSVVGRSKDAAEIIVSARIAGTDYSSFFALDLDDGTIGAPLFECEGAGVQKALVDFAGLVSGAECAGFFPRYEFLDPALTERVKAVQAALPSTAAYLEDWTQDFGYLLFRLTGGWTAGSYVLVGPDAPTPRLLANIREGIPREAVVPTEVIRYAAGDGLEIPALVTAREDVRGTGKAPLVVLPHGGPEDYDRYGFDWLAQYFASRGIVVLQPQFRGSTGFGATLRLAGRGEWGRAMSTDLDDGVRHLVEGGLVDPERVCIVGLSYGGYAALAAGAFSPFHYECLVSIAGIADLPRLLEWDEEQYGRESNVVEYWREQLGVQDTSRDALDPVSPVNFAGHFSAPVLLVHGRDDAIVPLDQSQRMEKALRRADKPVKLVRLKGEDHYLSGYETRLEALTVVAEFIEEHL